MARVEVNKKFHMLTVVEKIGSRNKRTYWKCLCECGNYTELPTNKIGVTKSCGCLKHKPQYQDLVGNKYGYLTVVQYDKKENDHIFWQCQCDCGTIKSIRGNDLKSGKIVSCGCLGKTKRIQGRKKYLEDRKNNPKPYKDLTGQQFNRLTVVKYNKEATLQAKDGYCYWDCKCQCGNTITVKTTNLTTGHTKSCGCLISENAKKQWYNNIVSKNIQNYTIDLTGQRFGKLVVSSYNQMKSGKGKGSFWDCKCDCGKNTTVSYDSLVRGATQSCGCLGNSKGEYLISQLLSKNNINYKQEVTFSDLKDKKSLRFDFGIYDDNDNLIKLIEYDGRQHTDKTSIWYTETIVKHDQMKTDYCKKHNIPLQRISYLDGEITLEKLGL